MAVQNHIHLSTTLGTAPENAPTLKWKALERQNVVSITTSIKQTLAGKTRVHVLQDISGPIVLETFQYKLKVQADYGYTVEDRIAQLKALNGRRAYLVDHFHANDNADHTADVIEVFCEVGAFPTDHIALQFFYVDVSLTDLSNEL